jgi:tyrosine-protein kinase Etk/Wzc
LVYELDPQNKMCADDKISATQNIEYNEKNDISLLDLIIFLLTKKRLIAGFMLIGCVVSVVAAFIVSPTYTATAVIMPPQQQSSTAAMMLGQLGGVASSAGQTLGLKNPLDPYVGILSGRTVADTLIKQFDLQKVYKTKTLVKTREKLAKRTTLNASKYALIQISVEDKDPKRAAEIANAYVKKLQEQNDRLAVTESSQRRLFFERQLEAEKNSLFSAEVDFKKMQEKKGVFQVNSQVEAVIRALAQMRAEVAAREVNLQRLKVGATAQNPEVLRQVSELKALWTQLQKYEATNKSQGDPLIPTAVIPEAGLEYVRRLREVKYHESLFELLAKQYELARVDEAKEAPIIQIVDYAIPPDEKSAPSRSLYILIGTFVGAFLGIMIVFLRHMSNDLLRGSEAI